MTAGTRPSRRTARAAPLPAFGRAVALSSLTVAIELSSLILLRNLPRRASRGVGAAGERAYSRASPERQGNRGYSEALGVPGFIAISLSARRAAVTHAGT